MKGDRIEVGESSCFETGSATIDAKSTDLQHAVADILKNTSAIAKLTIEGHTDSTGDAAFNTSLSQKRVDAMKASIEGKGIEAARFDLQGFGPDQPIASNDTEESRAQNRRVEFKATRSLIRIEVTAGASGGFGGRPVPFHHVFGSNGEGPSLSVMPSK